MRGRKTRLGGLLHCDPDSTARKSATMEPCGCGRFARHGLGQATLGAAPCCVLRRCQRAPREPPREVSDWSGGQRDQPPRRPDDGRGRPAPCAPCRQPWCGFVRTLPIGSVRHLLLRSIHWVGPAAFPPGRPRGLGLALSPTQPPRRLPPFAGLGRRMVFVIRRRLLLTCAPPALG